MGRRLLTKAPAVDSTGALLVNYAAGRTGGAQVTKSGIAGTQVCIPFPGESEVAPLPDRKYLVITNVSEPVYLGVDGFEITNGYPLPGAGRGLNQNGPPNLAKYSNRKQFLRGQYLTLPCLQSVAICARAGALEIGASLELS